MKCPFCGKELESDGFCYTCGEKISREDLERMAKLTQNQRSKYEDCLSEEDKHEQAEEEKRRAAEKSGLRSYTQLDLESAQLRLIGQNAAAYEKVFKEQSVFNIWPFILGFLCGLDI